MKKNLLGIVIILAGCTMSDSEYYVAKSKISEDLASDFFSNHYEFRTITYDKDDVRVELDLVNYSLISTVKDKCMPLLKIKNDNIDVKRAGIGPGTSYKLIDPSKVDLDPYMNCIQNTVNTTVLDAEDLYKMVNDPNYIKYKEIPNIREVLNKVKSDNRITIGEALDLYSLINIEIDKMDKQKYENTIKDL